MEKARLVLIHWNQQEGQKRAEFLRKAGFAVEWVAPNGNVELRPVFEAPPDAIAIDLTRLPSQSQAVALELRRRKSTRMTPLVILGGLPEKAQRLRALLPDATYTAWEEAPAAIREAIRNPPSEPVQPSPMVAYSGTPLIQKLGIGKGCLVGMMGAPEGFAEKLGPLPEGVKLSSRGVADRLLFFATSQKELLQRFPLAARRVAPGGALWICWPKRTSGMESDLSEAAVRRAGLDAGWVDYKICAVDETWSGLRFARRA